MKEGDWDKVRFPNPTAYTLIMNQMIRGLKPQGVFMSFGTDCMSERNRAVTEQILDYLQDKNCERATLSKLTTPKDWGTRCGMTIAYDDDEFCKLFEPNVPRASKRIKILEEAHNKEQYTWVSIEPYPCKETLVKYHIPYHPLSELLEKIDFVDFIVFGKWNYITINNKKHAMNDYRLNIEELKPFCEDHDIRLHIKTETMSYAYKGY
jgi:hypothetical protein